MSQQSDHPAPDQLASFGLGRLSPDESAWIERHLDACDACNETLVDLQDDTFAGIVRSIASCGNEGGEYAATVLGEESSGAPPEPPPELTDHPRYRIVELIGRGGMGDVYRAEHRLMHRPVALKLINARLVNHPEAVGRFQREVQAAAQLTHPNIVTAYDAEQAGDVHFLAMEYVEGRDLARVVAERGPLPVAEACDFIRQAATGLQHAHEAGMVHRDIKPQNLILDGNGQVRILDFGLAGVGLEPPAAPSDDGAAARSEEPLTSVGTVMGTPDYIAPEQARDARAADIRSDLYSLGCSLYFLLTGRPPHAGTTLLAKLMAHATVEPKAVEDVRVDVPAELAEVVRRLLAKDPNARFQTPAEVADALAPFVDRHRSGGRDGDAGVQRTAAASDPLRLAARVLATLGVLSLLAFGLVIGNRGWIRFQYPAPLALWLTSGAWMSLALGPLMLLGAVQLGRRKHYRLVVAAAAASLLPANPFSVGLFPVSLWLVRLLMRRDVRAAFHHDAQLSYRPPLGWVRLLLTGALSGALFTGLLAVNTDHGEIIVEVDDDATEVHVIRDGREVRVLTDGNRRITFVPSGDYEIRAVGAAAPGSRLEVSQNRITLSRGQRVFVSVRTVPLTMPARQHPEYDAALKAASRWLRLIHARKASEAWDELASQEMRSMQLKQDFVIQTHAQRDELGAMGLHRHPAEEFRSTLPPFGPGEYIVLTWQVRFGRGQAMEERVALVREAATWMVVAYSLDPAAPPDTDVADESAPTLTNSLGMQLARIPAGEFLMGSPDDEPGRKAAWERQHPVRITRPFYLGVHEVTQFEYTQVTGRDPHEFSPTGLSADRVAGLDTTRFPAESVSWDDAVAFCRLLSDRPEERRAGRAYRLPTEAEWEYACRAGTTTATHFGTEWTPELGNVLIGDPQAPDNRSLLRPTTVGSYPANVFGLHDMHGNVSEWVSDWFEMDYFAVSPVDDPPGPESSRIMPDGGARTIKGGSAVDRLAHARSAYRDYRPADLKLSNLGFRVVCVVDEQ